MSAFLQSGPSERQNLREIRVRFRPEAVGQSEANNKRSVSILVTTVPNRIDVKRQRSESQSEAAVS